MITNMKHFFVKHRVDAQCRTHVTINGPLKQMIVDKTAANLTMIPVSSQEFSLGDLGVASERCSTAVGVVWPYECSDND